MSEDHRDRIRRKHLASDYEALAREVKQDPQGFTQGVSKQVARIARNTADNLRDNE